MSLHTFERFSDIREMSPFRKHRISRELATAALPKEVAPVLADDSVLHKIEEIKALPEERIDQQLSTLIALANLERDASDTGEIPAVLTDAIHDTADHLVHEWQLDQHTYLSVVALTDAYALTHDHHLIETAMDVVHEKPTFVTYLPNVTDAVERSAETGEDYRTSIQQVQKPLRDLAMAVRAAESVEGGNHHASLPGSAPSVPIEHYEYLFHPTERRPDTPEYTHDGIHPSLKKK